MITPEKKGLGKNSGVHMHTEFSTAEPNNHNPENQRSKSDILDTERYQ